MATYTAEAITADGLTATAHTAAAGDKLTPDTNAVLAVINGSASEVDVTITAYGTTSYGADNADQVVTVAAGATTQISVNFPEYVSPTDGLIAVGWEATTDVTFTYTRI